MLINQIARIAALAALLLVVVHTNPEAEAMATNAKIGELRCRIYFGCTPTVYDMAKAISQRGDR